MLMGIKEYLKKFFHLNQFQYIRISRSFPITTVMSVSGEAAKGWGRQACEGQQPSCVQNFASAQPIEEYPPFKSKNRLV